MPPVREPVGVVITRRVHRTHTDQFEAALRALIRTAASDPASPEVEVLRGATSADWRDYHVVYRFEDADQLHAWEASPGRRQLIAQLEPLADRNGAARQQLTGLEAWFDLPSSATIIPSRARMALLTFLAIWPLVSLALKLLGPRLNHLPFVAQTACITCLLVVTMTYLVMPPLTRRFASWLTRDTNA